MISFALASQKQESSDTKHAKFHIAGRIFQKEELDQEYKQENDDVDEEFLPPERKPVRKKTGKARYKCAECDFTASTSALLKKHKKTSHKKVSNCEECGKELSSDYAMKCHMENYHGNQEYLCDKCDFISGSKGSHINILFLTCQKQNLFLKKYIYRRP